MGCALGCTQSQSRKEAMSLSKDIDMQIQRRRESEIDIVKLLLLGTGESGKSTVFKQLRIMYGKEYSEEDKRRFLIFMRQNSIESMEKLCRALWKNDPRNPLCTTPEFISICEDPSVDASGKTFDNYDKYLPLTEEKAQAIVTLWKTKAIQQVWRDRSSLHVIDSASNFFEKNSRHCQRRLYTDA